jgi:uncharacterized protein (DUF2141 family)
MTWMLAAVMILATDGGVQTGAIDVEIHAHVSTGTFWIALHNDRWAFPDQYERAFRKVKVKATSFEQHVRFENIPYGEYAVAVMHDENDNQKVDRNFFGMPTEEYGVTSNGVHTPRPKFELSAFKLNAPLVREQVVLQR